MPDLTGSIVENIEDTHDKCHMLGPEQPMRI